MLLRFVWIALVAALAVAPSAVATNPVIAFTEGEFMHVGDPVRRAVLHFGDAVSDFFHLDNLGHHHGPITGRHVGLFVQFDFDW